MFFGHRKDKGFSSGNKVQQYHGNGVESIVLMGKPFRVLQKLSDTPAPYMTSRPTHSEDRDKGRFVYLVENSCRLSEFPRHMALKRCVFNVNQVDEAHREIDILSRVKDKNICRVFHSEVSRSEGRLGVSIAMEYCSNNLYRRIRSGMGGGAGTRLSESEICHALLAVTSAVGYLHSQQPPIAHRDIRPENILINNKASGPAQFKLTNFSSATTEAYQCETREEASMAIADIEINTNPGFRSPEMADPWSKRRICEKSDLWSIGVLLYYMIYLKLPFEPTNMALTGNPKVRYPEGEAYRYSGSFRVVIDHLLEPDPEKRWDIFALTNFLRFDEDVSRHLGTFVFTRTEWPEGWEEQDVKVIGREPPPRAPPVTYNDNQVHETADEVRALAEGNRPNKNNNNNASSARRASAGVGDAVQEAMIALGGEGDDDPEMAAYRAQIIKEQQEALDRIRAASGRPPSPPTNNKDTDNNTAEATAQPQQEEKKDVFDDLFAPVPPPNNNNNNTTSPPPQQQQQQPPQQPQVDLFSADDLFAAPVNNNNNNKMMGGGYNNNNNFNNNNNPNQFSPSPYNNNNNNFNQGGWSSGLPQQQTAPGWGANNNNMGGAPVDFTNPGPGYVNNNNTNNNNNNNTNNNNNNNNAAPTKRKDPFADLFS